MVAEKEENTYAMHRLVQLSMKTWLDVHDETSQTKEDMLGILA